MALSYNKLWKLLIDKGLKKSDLHILAGLSQSTIAKLTKGENVNTEVLERICKALNCEIGDKIRQRIVNHLNREQADFCLYLNRKTQ